MTKPHITLITTEDGSHSLFREDIQETYHSSRGAMGESQYVFIKMGLDYLLENLGLKMIKIFEVGMGTGLNVLLSAQFAEKHAVAIDFHSIEPFPIDQDIYLNLNYGAGESSKRLLQQIHTGSWEKKQLLNDSFALTKHEITLESYTKDQDFDMIFFDAFAPSKQPEVWSLDNIKKCHDLLKSEGILTTYCAQGQFKRNLKEAGFELEVLQGAMGKKEMVRATKR